MVEADVSPTQITVEWEVKNFFDLPLDDGCVMRTRSFPFAKGQYLLRLCPNGESINKNAGWTCLYLIKICSPSEDRIACTVGVKRANGSIFQSRVGQSVFPEAGAGYGGGISSRAKLLQHRNEVAPNGNLTLFCSARLNSDGVKTVASQTAPLDTVSSELNDCKRQVKELEEKLSVVAIEKEELKRQIEDIKQGTLQTLSENFMNLFISGSQGDITVKTKDKDFTVHRGILVARSSVFRTMLEVNMVENNDGIITIEDCNSDCLESFLLFLYGGDLNVVSASNAVGLYYLADKYNVTELKRACSQCLCRELSTDTVCDVTRLAALHCETELLEAATVFFSSNMADIVSSPRWVPFLLDNTSVANELLVKAANYIKK